MYIDLRSIFSKHNIQWRDRGSNTSKGNVNIPCPFCKDDPSFHLAVSEDGKGYFCWRNQQHLGRKLGYLFRLLGIPSDYIPYTTDTPQWNDPAPLQTVGNMLTFKPAQESWECMNYLSERGFALPEVVCRDFNLKYQPRGNWAARLIVPLTEGWTGRTMREGIEPRYRAEANERSFFVSQSPTSAFVIVEGPLDALRIASVSSNYTVIATCGLARSTSDCIMNFLRSRNFTDGYVIPDSDVPFSQAYKQYRVFSSYLRNVNTRLVKLPSDAKDVGEMTESETLTWLHSEQFGDENAESGIHRALAGNLGKVGARILPAQRVARS